MTTAQSQGSPITMIDRVASLLQVFDGQPRLTLAQIARQAELPRSSAHRILQRLVELGWLEREGYQYRLGLRMFELGSKVVQRERLHQACLPFMYALHRSTGLTVHLSALVSGEVLHLERIGDWPKKGEGWRLGARQPAVHSAAGRAILAQLDEAQWPELAFPPAATVYGSHTMAQLRRDLERVRDRGGVALDVQGCSAGVTAVAAAIGPPAGNLRAALSLCGPAETTPTQEAGDTVRIAAMDIWYAASGVARRPTRPARRHDHPRGTARRHQPRLLTPPPPEATA
ncbi:DNA-binding IclR family transcriptional regulator [Streptosporangium becharense]|uniref:Glycerol operon regulatory protein n=1 Tax=Streptosporangium becharense TaxID=1816182 RepID=A0A7W9IMR6_9ACTN|nr:IclR family transcriptional regulator [Streptosporangium becharense]MBB2914371.1 DNA-binding IclR family transcriptional regulator [Streptosporangium becharense]MBB5823597.1 DNA-binding IclR family transcriptional regulator [Streptosporangium becharense]